MWIIICLIITILSFIILIKCIKGLREESNKIYIEMNEFRQIYCGIGAFVFVIVCIIVPVELMLNTENLIKELTIPEVVIYEYVKTQI